MRAESPDRDALEPIAIDPKGTADAFRYRITRQTAAGEETTEVPEHVVPEALKGAAKDTLE